MSAYQRNSSSFKRSERPYVMSSGGGTALGGASAKEVAVKHQEVFYQNTREFAKTYQGHHTVAVQLGLRYGMIFFIVSEIMFFLAFFKRQPLAQKTFPEHLWLATQCS
jgi:hypothetical protein